MIYVGGEKAKLYRGDYGPAQLYKGDTKIAGYTDVEKVGTQISGTETYNDQLNPSIDGLSEQTVTANSPSPDHPEPIRSSENFDVVSCGRNLFDKLIYKGLVTYTADGFTYTNKEMGRTHNILIPIKFKDNTRYTISYDAKETVDTKSAVMLVRFTDGAYQYLNKIVGDVLTHYSTATHPNHTVKSIQLSYARYDTATVITINNIQIVEGAVETPYQPYHATTAHVTNPLRSVGDVSDSIEVSDGKVEVVRRVENSKVTSIDPISPYGAALGEGLYGFIVTRKDIRPLWALSKSYEGVCTHFLQVRGAIVSTDPLEGIYVRGDLDSLFFKVRNQLLAGSTVLDFKKFLDEQSTAGTPVTVQYPLKTPTRTDITATPLGQALLALRTQPHYTQVYTNATLPPTLRARIKEMEL